MLRREPIARTPLSNGSYFIDCVFLFLGHSINKITDLEFVLMFGIVVGVNFLFGHSFGCLAGYVNRRLEMISSREITQWVKRWVRFMVFILGRSSPGRTFTPSQGGVVPPTEC